MIEASSKPGTYEPYNVIKNPTASGAMIPARLPATFSAPVHIPTCSAGAQD